jgi:hypothetical protein
MNGLGLGAGPVLLMTHVVSWPAGCLVSVVTFGFLIYRLLAERERRKTLEAAYRHAPAGTVVVQGDGPGGPPMWIRVGEGQRPEPAPRPVIWVLVSRRWRAPS